MENNAKIEVKGIGTCRLVLRDRRTLLLYDVLYVPSIRWNLFSVTIVINLGFDWFFSRNLVKLFLRIICYGVGYISNGLIIVDIVYVNNNYACTFITSSRDYEDDVIKWHLRLNHIGQDRINRLAKEGLLG